MVTIVAGDTVFETANVLEALWWIAIGAAFAVSAMLRRDRWRLESWLAAATFVLFGLSDVVEATTGAWWRPWWLLVWKGLCLVVLMWLMLRWKARRSV